MANPALPWHAHELAVEAVDLLGLQAGAAVHLGPPSGPHERQAWPVPEGRQLGQGRQEPVPDQQVTGQRADGAAEQLGIADVQDPANTALPAPLLPEHYVARFAAADQHEMTRRGRLRVVAVELQLRPASVLAMTSGSALILVRYGRLGHGRLGTNTVEVSRRRNLNRALSCATSAVGDRSVKW